MAQIKGFLPLLTENPQLIILGTMPSVASLKQSFYYAHPRNAFWPIMERHFGISLTSDEEKRLCLNNNRILLWDVLARCERSGSLDSAIKSPQANDFESLFRSYPDLKRVVFNGQKAFQLFKKQVLNQQKLPQNLQFLVMPSTSPANARLTLEDKWLKWQAVLSEIE